VQGPVGEVVTTTTDVGEVSIPSLLKNFRCTGSAVVMVTVADEEPPIFATFVYVLTPQQPKPILLTQKLSRKSSEGRRNGRDVRDGERREARECEAKSASPK